LFGEDVSASDAVATGMIAEAVPAERLDELATAQAAELAALPADALRYTRSMVARSFELDLAATLFEERAGQGLVSTTADFAEGAAAFLERRPPRFNQGAS
jgi:2-(1,2-epoxy-1,2-dihydrophenyl)acetyl-CoA isomerase